MNPYPPIEFSTANDIKALQEEKLQELLRYLNTHSAFYKNLFKEKGIAIDTIKKIEDLQHLPVTVKDDLHMHNDQFYCIPKDQIIDYSTTSGTMGDPVVFGLSENDLERLAYNEAISFACAGVKKGDVVQMMTTIDKRFMAGMAYFLGLRKLGAGIIRMGPGVPELQWDSIFRFSPTFLITIPSFLLKLIDYAEKNGLDYKNSSVKAAICIGESIKQQDFSDNLLAQKIKSKWNIALYSTYASTEMSTAFTACEFHKGGHLHPELIITEILDENNQPVPAGEVGELTVTTLGVEALPLLRFKTGDLVSAHAEPCSCGRNTLRLGPVVGRKQQMVKYKGTTLYPPAMVDLLQNFENVSCYQIMIQSDDLGLDEIILKVSMQDDSAESIRDIREHFRAKLRVSPKIQVIAHDELMAQIVLPTTRKPIYFIDNRK